jgi:two-component system chemotaxis sensor kinase CheA
MAALHGTIAASTEPRRGTRIELSEPVTVESQEVLHVQAGGAAVSIPREAVRQISRVAAADIASSPEGGSVLHGGKLVRFAALSRLLEPDARQLPASLSTLVLESAAGTAAVGVDHILGMAHVVIQSMPELLRATPLVSGAFLDDEGNPHLVLSTDDVIRVVRSGAGSVAQAAPARRPPLLVIDDSLTTRMLEQGILETAGYEVETAASGEEALEKARQRRYAIFIVDVEMPGMGGFAFIETARADPDLRSVPSIVLTSRDSEEDRMRGERLGARAYMVKSAFDEGQLLNTIRELVG